MDTSILKSRRFYGYWSPRVYRRLYAYAFVSLVFWVLTWIVWGGTGETRSQSVHFGWEGAVINGLLLIPLFSGSGWAKWLLIGEAVIFGGSAASLGFPPIGPAFGLLAFVALAQILLLFTLRGDTQAYLQADARRHSPID